MTAAVAIAAQRSWLLPSGDIVEATRAPTGAVPSPISTDQIGQLLELATTPPAYDAELRYLAYKALGRDARYGFIAVPAEERCEAVLRCASRWEMQQLMGGVG